MANNAGKALTNVAFRAKMLALIDKLNNQDQTALVRHVDDFEALNKDTFEAGMNAIIEAIPEGGGGGGGTGEGGYSVGFDIQIDMENSSEGDFYFIVEADKTIEDIIEHEDEQITGFLKWPFPADEDLTIDIYTSAKTVTFAHVEDQLAMNIIFKFDSSNFMGMMMEEEILENQLVFEISGNINENGNDSWTGHMHLVEADEEEETAYYAAGWPMNIALTKDSSHKMAFLGLGLSNALQDLYKFININKGFTQWYPGFDSSGQADERYTQYPYIAPYAKVRAGYFQSGSYDWYQEYKIFKLTEASFRLMNSSGSENYIILESDGLYYNSNDDIWTNDGYIEQAQFIGKMMIKIAFNNNFYPTAITLFTKNGDTYSAIPYSYDTTSPSDLGLT